VDVPRGGYYALKQLRENGGNCVTVSDERILEAQRELAAECGLFAEPAAAAVLAGFRAVQARIPSEAVVVLLITGNGLKDPEAAQKALNADRSDLPTEER
jgi:threonine synthase